MEDSIRRIYLDTNVFNKIADKCLFPIYPGSLGNRCPNKVFLSPINILEILQVTEDLRREMLVRVLQEICSEQLLAEPELLIVDFIAEQYQHPKVDQLRLDSLFPLTELGSVWKNIKQNPAETFVFNDNIRKKIHMLKLLNQLIHTWLKSGGTFDNDSYTQLGDYRGISRNELISVIRRTINEIKTRKVSNQKLWPFRDMLAMLITSVLVVGITPFHEPIDRLWELLDIKTTSDKLDFIFRGPLKFILSNGPLVGMAGFMAHQISERFNPGNLLDGFHITYLPYITELLTLDTGMLAIAEDYPESPNFVKVHRADAFINQFFL